VDEDLTGQLVNMSVEVPCPRCSYRIWAMLAEVIARSFVLCPCCRIGVRLVDSAGSAQNFGSAIEDKVRNVLKGRFR
jgi:hypothetical protein